MFDRLAVQRGRPRASDSVSMGIVPGVCMAAVGLVLLAVAAYGRGVSDILALLAIAALVPVVECLALPADGVRRTETATFALIVAAAGIHGGVAAAAIGFLGLAAGEWLRPRTGVLAWWLSADLLVSLVCAGTLVVAQPVLTSVALVAWLAFIAAWIWRTNRQRRRTVLTGVVMLAWVLVSLTMPRWMPLLAEEARTAIEGGVPALRFGLGFMTLDTTLVTFVGFGSARWVGVRFWRHELAPTFARYNVLMVIGAAQAALFVRLGFQALLLGGVVFVCALLVLQQRDQSRRRLIATICTLSSALDARDPYTKGHSDRVASYSLAIAKHLGWTRRQRREIELAAHLHDVGKIGVPDGVLLKPGRLTGEEFAAMKLHAQLSADMVRAVPEFRRVAEIIRQHHERLDGSGYPRGLIGEALLPAARILGVADSYDAMTSSRPYRAAMSRGRALRDLQTHAGRGYDAAVVAALAELEQQEALDAALQFGYCLTH